MPALVKRFTLAPIWAQASQWSDARDKNGCTGAGLPNPAPGCSLAPPTRVQQRAQRSQRAAVRRRHEGTQTVLPPPAWRPSGGGGTTGRGRRNSNGQHTLSDLGPSFPWQIPVKQSGCAARDAGAGATTALSSADPALPLHFQVIGVFIPSLPHMFGEKGGSAAPGAGGSASRRCTTAGMSCAAADTSSAAFAGGLLQGGASSQGTCGRKRG